VIFEGKGMHAGLYGKVKTGTITSFKQNVTSKTTWQKKTAAGIRNGV
jgi:hypothetical protein